MSWMKRPKGGPGTAPGAEQAPYNPTQPPISGAGQAILGQSNIYQNYQPAVPPGNPNLQPAQQQYWSQQPQTNYNQQYGQLYQQQDYGTNNANPAYQQYNQNYSNQAYATGQQQYQQSYATQPNQNHIPQQQQNVNYPKNNQNKDAGWDDTWSWGWDENAAKQNVQQQAPPAMQQPSYQNNANVLEESFGATDSWNWSVEERNEQMQNLTAAPNLHSQFDAKKEPATLPLTSEGRFIENNLVNAPIHQINNIQPIEPTVPVSRNTMSPSRHTPTDESNVRTLHDRDIVKERIPNLAIGKRIHLDNLTPQWSIESQMSQESSDGPQTHSESTYRSDNQSRNSSKSSPGLNTDNSNFNYSNSVLDEISPQNVEWSKNSLDEPTLVPEQTLSTEPKTVAADTNHSTLVDSFKEITISNCENPSQDSVSQRFLEEQAKAAECLTAEPVPQPSPTPPTVVSSSPPPMPPPQLHPPSVPSLGSGQNPFKRAGPVSHKSVSSSTSLASSGQANILPPMIPRELGAHHSAAANLSSPAAVSMVAHQQNRSSLGYSTANLETTPDNSERPDQPLIPSFRPVPVTQHMPENLEVAPKNDRNEYLQTAHLSSGDYGENTNFTQHSVPPPGLRRMVLGQQESEYSQGSNLSSDEPPPGLARMVPGQPTEADNSYGQNTEDYMDRHIDGQTMETSRRNISYRQADGQQTPDDDYSQNTNIRGAERRPIGLDRMVPGGSSNEDYGRSQQFQNTNYTSEQRVVTGLDRGYANDNSSQVREQNVDGSDYSEPVVRNQPRNVIGARDGLDNDISVDFGNMHSVGIASEVENQREVTVEGENLQDLSNISSAELSFSRDQVMDGADINTTETRVDRKTDMSDSTDLPASGSRRQSINRVNTSGDDSERDRAFKDSPRRDRDKHKSSREKDSRYSRDDRKSDRDSVRRPARDRDERRPEKDRRSERDRDRRDHKDDRDRPDDRRYRRSTRDRRYDTEDTDYYSDRERERRRYREGSYTSSKPPRPDDKDRRYREDRDRNKRYGTLERERKYDDNDRDGTSGNRRGDRERGRDERDSRYDDRDRRYRDIDPARKHGNIRREKEERKRGDVYSPSRPDSRDPDPTEDELNETLGSNDSRRRSDRHRRPRRDHHYDPYYDPGYAAGYSDPYQLQRQQQETYEYYERLRLSNPAAYMEVYKKVMAGQPLPPPGSLLTSAATADPMRVNAAYMEGYSSLGYDVRGEDRGSVHSGRSSANGLTGKDTDFNTDASLNLQLEESTVRSERMTPFKYSTAHVRGNISSRHLVMIHPSYPIDGLPATVQILDLNVALARDPVRCELNAYPGPLIKGVTHKKTVMEYCWARARAPAERRAAGADLAGYVLLWDLLVLLLRQNGMVIGTDIAELLMKNKREYEHKTSTKSQHYNGSRRGSALSSGTSRSEPLPEDEPPLSDATAPPPLTADASPPREDEEVEASTTEASESLRQRGTGGRRVADERAALDRFREYLLFGNRQEALEWAMSNGLWGHALQLSASAERRIRAAVASRFLAAQPPTDPLHTLYATLAGRQPPAATSAGEEKWGDWRPHLAMILSNASARPEIDKRAITALGDSLASRGLLYSSQFCYLMARLEFSRHPLAPLAPTAAAGAPPRLALLLASSQAHTLPALATNHAIFATEIYEYACSLSDDSFLITEFQVYKYLLCTRLVDAGLYERALGYAEQLARVLTAAPQLFSPRLLNLVADLADRLKYHDASLQEDPPLLDEAGEGGEEASPRHQLWLDQLKQVAHAHSGVVAAPPPVEAGYEQAPYSQPYGWAPDQVQQYQPLQTDSYTEPPAAQAVDDATGYDYTPAYYNPEQAEPQPPPMYSPYEDPVSPPRDPEPEHQAEASYAGNDNSYWNQDATQSSYGYGEVEVRPQISMPNAGPAGRAPFADYEDTRPPSPRAPNPQEESSKPAKEAKSSGGKQQGGGWFGGIFNKLSLKPTNQMILPDDKNPTIVWDPERKRWRNTDGDEEESDAPPPPPPRMADLSALRSAAPAVPPGAPAPPPGAPAPLTPASNIFKMQSRRNIKKSYVDVFNPSGAATRPLPPPGEVLGPSAPAASALAPNYFVPQAQQNSPMYDPSQYGSAETQHQ